MSAASFSALPVAASSYQGLKPDCTNAFAGKVSVSWTKITVTNGSKTYCMKTWNPINNKKFETLSYLQPLSEESIAKEIDYMIQKGWIPCLEFDEVGYVYRENSRMPNYYDGRYWTLWKLPMFGCNDSSQVMNEIEECKKAENSRMPNYYDGRYWTLWKLPMFGCNDSSQVMNEIEECKKAYPNAYIRCLAFDNIKQVQCMAFLIQKPNTAS